MSATEYRIFYDKCAEHYRFGAIYRDATYEFRNVTLPRKMLRWVQPDLKLNPDSHTHTLKLLSEEQWRHLGIRMSTGWENYARHDPEPHVLMFRRTHEAGNRARIAAAKREEEMGERGRQEEEEGEEEGVGASKP
ncbi:regulatory subunit of cyclin-dependent kinase [Mortierella sp. GBAus27b]|nr:regulatory subunit of cyclin-dependent kinase [Mortierella sp. GBAus27b]